MFAYKPNYEQVFKHYEAWWDAQVVDRALTSIVFNKPKTRRVPVPEKTHTSWRERWLDFDFVAERTAAVMANRVYAGDALPTTFPNLGPEVFSAYYGCPMEYSETTSWSEPVLADWSDASVDALVLDTNNFYYRKILELTDVLLEVAKGKFIVGYTDLHGGGDAIAAFRDPQKLCIDMIEHPKAIKRLNERITGDFLDTYDMYYKKLTAAGMPSTTWLNATCTGKYHVPSNDFSCMVSTKMFVETFLPGIIRECKHMDRNIYHLDGPQALRYLDLLLDVPEIHAIQWVPGAGNDYWLNWLKVYQRIQEVGKSFCFNVPLKDLDTVFEVLRPEGVWMTVSGVPDQVTADSALAKIARWGK